MSQAATYITEIEESLNYLPTWLPTHRLQLGDIVVVEDSRMRVVGSVESYGVPLQFRSGAPMDMLRHTTRGAVSVRIETQAKSPQPNSNLSSEARIRVDFSRAHAVLFAASKCRLDTIANLQDVGAAVLDLLAAKCWRRNWLVVTDLVRADLLSVIIASQAGATIESATNAETTDWAQIMSGGLNLASWSSSGLATEVVGARSTTPLFRCSGIRLGLLGWAFRGANLTPSPTEEPSASFGEVSSADLRATLTGMTP